MRKMEQRQQSHRLTKQDIFKLLNQGDVELLRTVNNASFGFENFIRNQGYFSQSDQIDFETFDFIMKAVCRICNIRHNSCLGSVHKFLNMLTSHKKFLCEDVLRAIYDGLDHEHCIDMSSFTKNYVIVLKTILKYKLNSAQEIIDDAYPSLQNILNEIKNRKVKNVEIVQREYDVLKRLVDTFNVPFLHSEKDDQVALFRQLSIMPKDNDVINCEVPDLPCNKIDGPYNSVNHYLSVHFHLMREDMLRTFRDCIAKHINPTETHKIGTQTYEQVSVLHPPTYTPEGICYGITIKTDKPIDSSKKVLMPGNIVCLTNDDYKSVIFAVVRSKQPRTTKSKSTEFEVVIRVEDAHDEISEDGVNYLMFETNAYFECYKHVLCAIKEFDENSFPLSDFLVYFDFQNPEPDYLVNSDDCIDIQYCVHEKCDGFGNNLKTQMVASFEENDCDRLPCGDHQRHRTSENRNTSSNKVKREGRTTKRIISCECKKFNPLVYDDWPTATELEMDDHQVKAFQTALTKKVAVVQGPPGTGKTFIGVKVVKALLKNLPITPIVVCCLANHALDQFLEHISKFTKNFVRLGSQSKSNILEAHTLNNLMIAHGIHSRDSKSGALEMNNIQKSSLNHLKLFIPELLKSRFKRDSDPHLKEIIHVSRKLNELYESFYLCKDEYLKESALNEIISKTFKNQLQAGSETNSPLLTTSVLEWLCCSRNTKLYEACKIRLQRPRHSTIADNVSDLWTLSLNNRFQLFFFWREKCLNVILNKINKAKEEYKRLRTTFTGRAPDPVKIEILKKSLVIGVTTTGAAKYRKLLRFANPKVLVVEEAAEVLESHVISSLLPTTQHLILIGDHKQLRPFPANHELSEVYKLKISMFERLFQNGAPSATLVSQHRMKPSIAQLLVQDELYPDLKNYENVYKYEDVKGIKSNIFFLNHSKGESSIFSGTSFSNDYEANMIVLLVKYLTIMSHAEEQITVLATYAAQVLLIQSYLEEMKLSVFVTTVDNYQGEENDIVLVSFVRSNSSAFVGFLKENNRVCVALSRARKGMYCLGNFSSYSFRSSLWKNIVKKLQAQSMIGPNLPLTCGKHAKVTFVEYPEDVHKLMRRGCGEVCGFLHTCGHVCSNKCHYNDPDHSDQYKCALPCEKYISDSKKCPYKCFESCKITKNAVILGCGHSAKFNKNGTIDKSCGEQSTKLLPCNHEDKIPCGTDMSVYKCRLSVQVVLPCGHKKNVLCHKSNDLKNAICTDLTPRTSPCGHTVHVPCSLNLLPEELLTLCTSPCDQSLTCEHACTGTCRRCSDTGIHARCQEKCEKRLECGHLCSGHCGSPCPPCEEDCLLSCSHYLKCINRCDRPCNVCEKKCQRRCKHGACTNKCSEPCSVQPCLLPCSEKLPCGHKCIGFCGDTCPPLCGVCDLTPGNRYVQLDDCGHVIDSDALQKHIDDELESYLWPDCPECKKPMQRSLRYKDELLKAKVNFLGLSNYSKVIENVHHHINSMVRPNTILPLEFRDVHRKVTDILLRDKPTSGPLLVLQNCVMLLMDLLRISEKLKETESAQQNLVLHSRYERLLSWVCNNLTCASYQQLNEVDKAVEVLKNNFIWSPNET